eukprot:Selendium_serpulae@DN5200_c0_g1_i2.p1
MRRRNIYQALLIATLVGAAFAQEANIRSVQAAADVVDAAKDSEEAEEDIADELPVGAANASEPEAKAGGVKAQSATGLKETEMTGCSIPDPRYDVRYKRAIYQSGVADSRQPQNGDRLLGITRDGVRYSVAVFSKTMLHNAYGEVLTADFQQLERAMATGKQADFNAIRRTPGAVRKLANPQAALAVSLEGGDAWSVPVVPAPRMQSATTGLDMVYVYGQALLRDAPFYAISNKLTSVEHIVDDLLYDLNQDVASYYGPLSVNGVVDRHNLFRGNCVPCLVGPVVSQFLLYDFAMGSIKVVQDVVIEADKAYSVSVDGWLDIQKGLIGPGPTPEEPKLKMCNWRAVASYVHNDPPCSAFVNAVLILMEVGAPLDPNIADLKNEAGFVTFGVGDILAAINGVCLNSFKAAWRQKWGTNLRLRPEVMAGRIHFTLADGQQYGIHPIVLKSRTVQNIHRFNKQHLGYATHLLPMMYQEGSPTHPSYVAGHATVSGAAATIVKAFFDDSVLLASLRDSKGMPFQIIESVTCTETFKDMYTNAIKDPVVVERLTLGGEIDKLAFNIAMARCAAGVHYPTDSEGIYLGEKMAIRYLEDIAETYNEDFHGFTFRRFDGKVVSIRPSKNKFPKPTNFAKSTAR